MTRLEAFCLAIIFVALAVILGATAADAQSDWILHYNTPADALLTEQMFQTKTGTRFRFSQDTNHRENYLCKPYVADLTGKNSLSYRMLTHTVSGTPKFQFLSPTNQCKVGCNPVSAHPMLWVRNTDLSDTTNRWWSQEFWPLPAEGQTTLNIPLDASHWTGVLGQKAGPDFDKQVIAICLTFGGGWYAGHGTYTTHGLEAFEIQGLEVR